jgi:hypothetical protein
MGNSYLQPSYNRGSSNVDAANMSNTIVKPADLKGGKQRRRRTIKRGGATIVYDGPQTNPTPSPTNYSIPNTGQNLAAHSANAQVQSRGDTLNGGRKRRKSKRRKSKRRKSK